MLEVSFLFPNILEIFLDISLLLISNIILSQSEKIFVFSCFLTCPMIFDWMPDCAILM